MHLKALFYARSIVALGILNLKKSCNKDRKNCCNNLEIQSQGIWNHNVQHENLGRKECIHHVEFGNHGGWNVITIQHYNNGDGLC